MILYVYDTYRGNRTTSLNTEQLIALALRQYALETGMTLPGDRNPLRICRTHKGKPFVEHIPLHFSVSHSDHLWVCLVGAEENGVDIQNKSHSNYDAIARRFFQPEEQLAVQKGGVEAFMAIWCRKEAFIKYHGMTIGETIDWLNVATEGVPAEKVEHMGTTVIFTELQVHPEFFCVAATDNREMIWIKEIQAD